MINYSDFKDCIIANINGFIRPVVLISTMEDSNNKMPYNVYKDLLNGKEYIQHYYVEINSIFYYMTPEEINKTINEKSCDDALIIIDRAIMVEEKKLKDEEIENKKTLKP